MGQKRRKRHRAGTPGPGSVRHRNIWDIGACELPADLAPLVLMLSRLTLMVQAAGFERNFFDVFSPFNDGCVTPEVGVGWCDVSNALVVTVVVIMIDEDADLIFEVAL